MRFNPSKLDHITITRRIDLIDTRLTLNNTEIPEPNNTKYLGVSNLAVRLKWDIHINIVTAKTNSVLEWVKRFQIQSSGALLHQLLCPGSHSSGVCAPALDSLRASLEKELETVQHRVVHYVCNVGPMDCQTRSMRLFSLRFCELSRSHRNYVASHWCSTVEQSTV